MASTLFAKTVKKRLIDLDKSTGWLCEAVSEKTGLYFDTSYLSKIMRGSYAPEKMVAAICEVLGIEKPPRSKRSPVEDIMEDE